MRNVPRVHDASAHREPEHTALPTRKDHVRARSVHNEDRCGMRNTHDSPQLPALPALARAPEAGA